MEITWRSLTVEGITWRRLNSCWWILFTFTILTSTSHTLQGRPTSTLLLRTGSTLVLNCSLPADEQFQGYNASDLRFRFKNQEWPADHVRVEDESTAKLQLPDANRTLTGSWSCALRDRIQPLFKQSVTIADLPVKPNITGCVVYNWDSMTCTWDPKQQDTGIPTTQTLYWTLLGEYEYHCPEPGPSFCTWPRDAAGGDHTRLAVNYKMYVSASNELGKSNSSVFKIFTDDSAVKPNPVKDLNAVAAGPNTVALSWTEPKESKTILYKINYRRKDTLTWRESNVTSTTAKIEGLLPYRFYAFSITCIPGAVGYVSGFWSNITNITIRTDTSVPSAAPAISPGGFRTLDDQHNKQKRKAYIFWKSIPEEERNGLIERYRVRYRAVLSDKWEYEDIPHPTERMGEISLDKDKAYQVVIDAATKVGYNETLANSLTPLYIAQKANVPPTPRKLAVMNVVEENLVEMNWTAVQDAVGYTVYWCQGSAQFRTCHGELDWISVDENTTSYNVNLTGSEPKHFIFGISAETIFVNDVQQEDGHRERRSAAITVSSGIKWGDCTHRSDKPVLPPQAARFAEHQESESITLEWTHPKCGESAYIDEYIISYCQVPSCPVSEEDADSSGLLKVSVDNELEDFTLVGLTPLVEYRVWVQSHSPNKGLSYPTEGQHITVQQSGLSKGVIVVLCIVGIIVGFFILFGLYQTVKRTCRTVKENTTLKVELPPDVGSTFSHSNYEVDADYMQNYNTLLAVESQDKESKGYPRPPNGTQGRGFFTNGFSRSKDTTYGVGVSGGSTSSNDTMLTLLQHPSADSLDDVFDSGMGASIAHDLSVSSGLRLPPVPEEAISNTDDAAGRRMANYERQTSGTSQHSTSTIPPYSQCAVPDSEVTGITNEETPSCSAIKQTGCLSEGLMAPPHSHVPQHNTASPSPRVPSQPAATIQTPVGTSTKHQPIDVGQSTKEPLGTKGLNTINGGSRTDLTPRLSGSLPQGEGSMDVADPAGAGDVAGEADYSVVNTGGSASPSTCKTGASSPHHTYIPQYGSAENTHLPNGTYKRPTLESDWGHTGESTGIDRRHDPCHIGLLPAVKSAATNNNNGYVTVSM